MGFESLPQINLNEKPSTKVVSGIDNQGNLTYEEFPMRVHPLSVSTSDYNRIMAEYARDYERLPESDKTMRFKVGQFLILRIKSTSIELYEVGDVRKGHYLLVKAFFGQNPVKKYQDLVIESSRNSHVRENPDLIVCTEQEVEGWLKSMSR